MERGAGSVPGWGRAVATPKCSLLPSTLSALCLVVLSPKQGCWELLQAHLLLQKAINP